MRSLRITLLLHLRDNKKPVKKENNLNRDIMDKGTQTMIDNLKNNTGKTLEEWVSIVNSKSFAKHGEIMSFLKSEYTLTHGFANLIALAARNTASVFAEDTGDLIEKQYKGKESLRVIYEKIMKDIAGFGKDIEVAPKNAYVSLRRKKQFAILQPATKTRFEIGLNIKGERASGVLEEITAPNSMCSHKMNLQEVSDLTPEVIAWMKKAYELAG